MNAVGRGLVSPQFVAQNILQKNPKFKVLDASLKPRVKASPLEDYLFNRINGAKFFDIENNFSDTSSPFPHAVPSLSHFKQQINRLSIQPDDFIVAYDSDGIFASPRCWWLFKVMGWREDKVAVLDGGMAGFQEKYPDLIDFSPLSPNEIYSPNNPSEEFVNLKFQDQLFRDVQFIERNFETKEEIVLDARSAGRFKGVDPEPRPHLKSGHMPHSVSVPFTAVLNKDDQFRSFKSPEQIKELFDGKGIDIYNANEKPLVTSCGSGITACIDLLALYSSGCKRKMGVYDGSWSEYADTAVKERPILNGE